MIDDDDSSQSSIEIGGSVEADANVVIGDDNVQLDAAITGAWQSLQGAPELLDALARRYLPSGSPLPIVPQEGSRRGSSIRIGGNARARHIVVGRGNVQVSASPLPAALSRLSTRERVDVLRQFAPTDALLEQAERLDLLAAKYETFERNVSPQRAELDPAAWRRRLAALERMVGVFESGSRPIGTCFLVGRDLVLTNFHVVKAFMGRRSVADELAVRFDFTESSDPGVASVRYAVAPEDWCVVSSPYSQHDTTGIVPAEQQELDFALIRLAEPAGEDTTLGARRGWLSLTSARRPGPGESLIILQHPRGQRLKLCFGKVLAVEGGTSRIRYDTNTDAGSSGAPCLNENLEVVALHHMGDPNFSPSHVPVFNQGIPISIIAERLSDHGIRLPLIRG